MKIFYHKLKRKRNNFKKISKICFVKTALTKSENENILILSNFNFIENFK
jgi:hypothetical protein